PVADPRSSDGLLCLARDISREAGIDVEFRTVHEITGDWEPFKRAGVDVINFHSLDRRSLRTLHSHRDRLENISRQKLDDAWRMAMSIVVSLDAGR
ncbi:MAG: hypothetical protein HUJ31_19000, partial [Pseudomonadales bacterium]|nr:hypothetical protein [Pseudomonadales bacterium]